MQRSRKAVSLIEMLVVMAIVGVLIALLLPAVQRVRESARRAECENHLHQLGIAFHAFHDSRRAFPLDQNQRMGMVVPPVAMSGPAPSGTFYADLLPFIDENVQVNTTDPLPIKIFLCPSRRDGSVGARTDYGYGMHKHAFHNSSLDGITWITGNNKWRDRYSILGGIYKSAIKLSDVSIRDGASSTALLTHKGMAPQHYKGTGSNDGPWNTTNYFDYKRYPAFIGKDTNQQIAGVNTFGIVMADRVLTSPHPGSTGVLMADGSLRAIRYGADPLILSHMWDYNGNVAIDFDNLPPAPPATIPTPPNPNPGPGGLGDLDHGTRPDDEGTRPGDEIVIID